MEEVFKRQIDIVFEAVVSMVVTPNRRDVVSIARQRHLDGAECTNPEEVADQMLDAAAAAQERPRNSEKGNDFELNALCLLAANAVHRLRRGDVPGAVNSLCYLVRMGAVFSAYAVMAASNPAATRSKESAILTNLVIDRYRELKKERGLKKNEASTVIFEEHLVPWGQENIRNALKGVE